jgi:5-methylcytosine-specific restriction endonuclease McrA
MALRRMKRKAITDKMKLEGAICWGSVVCTNCCIRFKFPREIEWDHFNPVAMGGRHDDSNIRPLCKECHKLKTFGSKATTAGSDIHKIAKVKRIAKGGKTRKGPPMKSRGFDKKLTRHFDGTTEARR